MASFFYFAIGMMEQLIVLKGIGEHERRRNKRVKKVNLRLPDPLDIAVATVEESLQVD